ncbi:hypothetical protein J5N97_003747 [Dioscorea zingiberensis]|uniref:Uncharacterized protein n=1 Tax=Dioscorea zingiberensis TaxID=325984 RepID=A0A9D5D570_9LILI|nr:hypothetical protein J5N97_003747 [Dioscorea zingiberensis]
MKLQAQSDPIYARIASNLVTMQENVLMWLFTTVFFLGTLQLSALRKSCAGTARNLATQQASAPMRA